MKHQNGLVPIGEALNDLPGPIRKTTSQALHHFIQADQVNSWLEPAKRTPIWASWRD